VASLKYSSVAAFLAHLRALEKASPRTEDDERILALMRGALAELSSDEREALSDDSSASPRRRRHRERAELKLSSVLTTRGLLAG
jgi:cytochrome c-type biogenesis protein CcmH/NrfG